MLRFYKFLILFICSFYFLEVWGAQPQRILSQFFDLSKNKKLYLYSGRVSLIEFPCAVEKIILGSANDLKVHRDKNSPKELYLWLESPKAQSSNLIVKCDQRFFIFDVYANRASHQDYLKILSGFKAPRLTMKKIDGSHMKGSLR